MLGSFAAEVVDKAIALLALIVVGQSGRQFNREAKQLGVPCPAELAAPKSTIKFDDAAAGKLAAAGECQILLYIALAAIHHQRQLVVIAQSPLVIQPGLVVAHGLARVEGVSAAYRLTPILAHLSCRQTQRVLSLGLIQAVDQQRQT